MNAYPAPTVMDRYVALALGLFKLLAFLCGVFALVAFLSGNAGAALGGLKGALYCLVPVYAPALAVRFFK